MNPFDVLTSINFDKKHIFKDNPELENQYPAFMVNRGLSYFPDTIMYANQTNGYSFLDNRLQYDFLFYGVTKRKRFSKWAKKEPTADTIRLIMDYYKYSEAKAIEAASLLTEEQIKTIEEKMYKGGKS